MNKLLLVLLGICCFSCAENNTTTEGRETTLKDTLVTGTSATVPEDTGIYSIVIGDSVTISLQQWDSTIDLQQQLGKPVSQKTRELDKNSDTFSGSFIKDLEYPGLKLQLFSPPQNGKMFWVQEIILTDSTYRTTKDVRIGDELQKVQHVYPALQKFPGENENMFYIADAGYEKSIEMEFENDKLKKLRMYYSLN